ncbi:MAG: hypothetical protein ACOYIH_03700 [Candidatus Fimadaptatus sp.]|jgi:hypothetical protein
MGGFICVALIVIAIVWDKVWRFMWMLYCDSKMAEGCAEHKTQEHSKNGK